MMELPNATIVVEVTNRDRKLRKQVTQLYRTVNKILANQNRQLLEERFMSEALDRLVKEVSETRGVVNSAITLLGNLSEQIRANAADEDAMVALADDLDKQQGDLAAAVQAGSGTGTGIPVEEPSTESTQPVEPTGEGALGG